MTKRWTYPYGRPGRPSAAKGTTVLVLHLAKENALVLHLAKENAAWGYRRIHGELATMGVTTAPLSVSATSNATASEPSPPRSGPTWSDSLAAHAKGVVACDFFHVDTVLLRRLYVLVFIHHDTRLLRIAVATTKPIARWETKQARKLCMELSEQPGAVKSLIRNRDTKFTPSFDAVLPTRPSGSSRRRSAPRRRRPYVNVSSHPPAQAPRPNADPRPAPSPGRLWASPPIVEGVVVRQRLMVATA